MDNHTANADSLAGLGQPKQGRCRALRAGPFPPACPVAVNKTPRALDATGLINNHWFGVRVASYHF